MEVFYWYCHTVKKTNITVHAITARMDGAQIFFVQETIDLGGFEARLTSEGKFLSTGDPTAKIFAKNSS